MDLDFRVIDLEHEEIRNYNFPKERLDTLALDLYMDCRLPLVLAAEEEILDWMFLNWLSDYNDWDLLCNLGYCGAWMNEADIDDLIKKVFFSVDRVSYNKVMKDFIISLHKLKNSIDFNSQIIIAVRTI